MLHPAVDPVQAIVTRLRHAIASRPGLGEFNYRRLSRRVPPETAILPSNRRPIPRITVIIDTSASMEGQDISLALGAVALVCRGLPDPRGLKVIAGDTQAQACARVFRPENVALKGGGGTHMGYIVREEAKETPKPSVILVITDGYTPWLSQHEMNGIRLIVCLTQRANKGMVPTWAETVMLCGD
jgi:predicted metal-dependent peptidase